MSSVLKAMPVVPKILIACWLVGGVYGPASAQARGPVIDGEQFVRRVITDPQQGGIPAVTMHLPASWRMAGKVVWNYAWTETPVALSCQAENPANAEAYFFYPMLRFDSLQVAPNLRQYAKNLPKPGERLPLGPISLDPRPPAQTMAMFIRQLRGREPNFQWVGKEDLPGLARALGLGAAPGQQGIAVKVRYELNGQPVEEAFYAVYFLSPPVNKGGVSQTNWGLRNLQSFRAPAGTLGKRMAVFAAIATSVHPTPQWTERAQAVEAQLTQIFNQKLKQGDDQIHASLAMAQEVMANERSFDQGVNAFIQANRASGGGGAGGGGGSTGGRSVWDKADDITRGVDTTNDPMTGTSQHSFLEQYHWTDGFGNYRDSNDPNYDPSKDEAGNWTLMTPAQ